VNPTTLSRRGTGTFENDPFGESQTALPGKAANGFPDIRKRHLPGVQAERRAVAGDQVELVRVNVNCDNGGAQGACNLRGVSAHSTDADDDGKVAFAQAGANHRLVRGSHCIRYHCHVSQTKASPPQTFCINRAEAKCRYVDMRSKAAVYVVAGHLLLRTDRETPTLTEVADAAGNDRRYDDG